MLLVGDRVPKGVACEGVGQASDLRIWPVLCLLCSRTSVWQKPFRNHFFVSCASGVSIITKRSLLFPFILNVRLMSCTIG